ncbi:hypothetical protein NL154_05615 [Rhizobium sp. YTUHZ044]|uniref:hypothetical protein n=1 Tax=Rhizobium sp. YTUHZ044 TaxID=2962678 RepID=UPI003DA82A95
MNDHGNPLPSAIDLAGMLKSQTLADLSASLGVSRKAITTKLRRHGMALGMPTRHYVSKNQLHGVISVPLKKEKTFHPDRVARTTLSGAVVTLPRIPTIDGY